MAQTRVRKKKVVDTALQAHRVVIYLRVSTDEQVKSGFGLAAQIELCEKYAAAHNYTIVGVQRDEGLSGTLPMAERAGITGAITMGVIGQADIILAYAQDRYARDTGVWSSIRSAATKAGLQLLTVKENTNFAAQESQFMGDIHAAVAAEERRTIAKRLYGGRRQKSLLNGRGSGFLPHGFRKVVETVNNQIVERIEIDLEAQKAIRTMIAARDDGKTYQQIADIMTQHKFEKPHGGTTWSFGNVQQLLLHEQLYRTGIRTWDDVQSLERWPVIV